MGATSSALLLNKGLSNLGAAFRTNAEGPNAAAETTLGAPDSVLAGIGRGLGGERGQALGSIVNAAIELGSGASAAFRGEASTVEVVSMGMSDLELHNAGQELNEH